MLKSCMKTSRMRNVDGVENACDLNLCVDRLDLPLEMPAISSAWRVNILSTPSKDVPRNKCIIIIAHRTDVFLMRFTNLPQLR
jgi:hypothetical protein